MPTLKTTVLVDLDDEPVTSFILTRRTTPTKSQSFVVTRATGGGFVALPITEITTIQALILTSDQPVSIRFDGAAGAVALGANVTVAFHGTTWTAVPTVSNASGNTATISGLALGT